MYWYLFNLLGITTLTFAILGALFGLALGDWRESLWFTLGGVIIGTIGMTVGFVVETFL